jgi:PPOX class probable F420-dependent enzyme
VADLDDLARLMAAEDGLVVVSTRRANGTIQSSVVNAGVLAHPVAGQRVVGLVAGGGTRKLVNLRGDPHLVVVGRHRWSWAAAEGRAELIGPDDPAAGIDAEGLRQLLRDVFTAAGGSHDDWDTYDRVMAEERRTAVLLAPARVYGNG